MKRFTKEDLDILRREFLAGADVTLIAGKLGHSPGVIRQKAFHIGLRRNKSVTIALRHAPPELIAQRAKMTDKKFIAAIQEYRDGIAKEAKLARKKDKALRDARVRLKCDAIDAAKGSRAAKMTLMREAGATLEEVGKRYDITRERVRQITSARYRANLKHKQMGNKNPPIKTALRIWGQMTPTHRQQFLDAIGAQLIEPVMWS